MNEINSKIPGTKNESADLLQLVSFMIGNENMQAIFYTYRKSIG